MGRALAFIAVMVLAMPFSSGIHASPNQATVSTQTTAPPSAGVPANTQVLGKLLSNLDAAQAKVGDPLDVQFTEDIKSGHTQIKKGSILNGRITSVQPFSSAGSQCVVGILFDRVTLKNGEQLGLSLHIQALAPQSDVKSDTLMDGRGMAGTNQNAIPAGHADAMTGTIDGLSHKSMGVYGMKGVSLANQTEKGEHISLVISTAGNIQLKKGAQLLLQAVE
jgi:hypothetical protein